MMMKMGQCSCYLLPFSFSSGNPPSGCGLSMVLPAVDWTGTELVTVEQTPLAVWAGERDTCYHKFLRETLPYIISTVVRTTHTRKTRDSVEEFYSYHNYFTIVFLLTRLQVT